MQEQKSIVGIPLSLYIDKRFMAFIFELIFLALKKHGSCQRQSKTHSPKASRPTRVDAGPK
jgi:hypothetical protein